MSDTIVFKKIRNFFFENFFLISKKTFKNFQNKFLKNLKNRLNLILMEI